MKIVVVGGCGHVGLPLAVSLASTGNVVTAFDINPAAVSVVNGGNAPFYEAGLDSAIQETVGKTFVATTDGAVINSADVVVMIVGTPLDVHLNPDPNAVVQALAEITHHLKDGQLLVLRSTVFPGVTKRIEALLESSGIKISVAFCPERIVEGQAMKELREIGRAHV